MFQYCRRYCLAKFRTGPDAFLKITNLTDLTIFFIFQYNTEKGTKTKQSPPINKNGFYKMYFPSASKTRAFNVLQDTPAQEFICNKLLEDGQNFYHFNVVESPTGPICVQDIC